MRFWGDENISGKIIRILDLYDSSNEYRQISDEFDRGTPDEVWIPGIARQFPDSIILSGDRRILKDRAQRTILDGSGLSFIYPDKTLAGQTFEEQIWRYLKVWPRVLAEVVPAQARQRPGIWEIPFNANKLIK